MLKLTAVDNMSLSFEKFPAPFVRDGSMNNLQIIMPDEKKDEDMQAVSYTHLRGDAVCWRRVYGCGRSADAASGVKQSAF